MNTTTLDMQDIVVKANHYYETNDIKHANSVANSNARNKRHIQANDSMQNTTRRNHATLAGEKGILLQPFKQETPKC